MTNCLIGWQNWFVTGTVSSGTALDGAPASNLGTDSGGDYWRSTATTDYVQIDAGSAVAWRAVMLTRTNLTTAATIRIRLGTSAGAGDVYDSGTISAGIVAGYQQAVKALPASYTARHCRIDLADASNPDGFLKIGLGFAGPMVEVERNFAYGSNAGMTDRGIVSETNGGQEYVTPKFRARTADLNFQAASEADAYSLFREIDWRSGIGGNIATIPDPDAAEIGKDAIFGRRTELSPVTRAGFTMWSVTLRLKERL